MKTMISCNHLKFTECRQSWLASDFHQSPLISRIFTHLLRLPALLDYLNLFSFLVVQLMFLVVTRLKETIMKGIKQVVLSCNYVLPLRKFVFLYLRQIEKSIRSNVMYLLWVVSVWCGAVVGVIIVTLTVELSTQADVIKCGLRLVNHSHQHQSCLNSSHILSGICTKQLQLKKHRLIEFTSYNHSK